MSIVQKAKDLLGLDKSEEAPEPPESSDGDAESDEE